MATDTVASIAAWLVHVPLLEEWVASPELGGHLHGPPRLILCLRDEEGREGWGEGTTTLTHEEIHEVLGNLVGWRLGDLRLIMLDLWGGRRHTSSVPFRLPRLRQTPPIFSIACGIRFKRQWKWHCST